MSAPKITWDNKVSIDPKPTIPEINKVTDDNMNNIKSVVGKHADLIDNLQGSKEDTDILKEASILNNQVENNQSQKLRNNSPLILTEEAFNELDIYDDRPYFVIGVGRYFGGQKIYSEPFSPDPSDYHVKTPANGGSDANSGTESSPFATIDYAISQLSLSGGETIWVHEGEYVEDSGSGYLSIINKNFITTSSVRSVPNNNVIIKHASSNVCLVFDQTVNNLDFYGLTFKTNVGDLSLVRGFPNSILTNVNFYECYMKDDNNVNFSFYYQGQAATHTNLSVKRCIIDFDGNGTISANNIDNFTVVGVLDFSRGTSARLVSLVDFKGTAKINSNTINNPNNSPSVSPISQINANDNNGASIEVCNNTITGPTAMFLQGGTSGNPITCIINDNIINTVNNGLEVREGINGGECRRNRVITSANVGLGFPTDGGFTGITSVSNFVISGNYVEANGATGHGILVSEYSDNVTVDNNVSVTNKGGKHSVVIKGSNHTVTNNLMYGGTSDGLYFKGAKSSVANSNVIIQSSGGNCIHYAPDDEGVTAENNRIYNNTIQCTNGTLINVPSTGVGDNNTQDFNKYSVSGLGVWGNMFLLTQTTLEEVRETWANNYPSNPTNDANSVDIG